ncbi:MAG TPA: DinB family protein [Mucilaginibacter sp.]|nr:DinB family protein [Mucilaginibacter sp.]
MLSAIAIQIQNIVNEVISADIDNIDWESKSSPGKWSAKQIIGHLTDSAMINLQRFVRCTYEENFRLTYEQDEWVAAQHYQEADITDLLTLWRALNMQISRILYDYPADRVMAKCDNSKTEPALHTVASLAEDYVRHMEHHISQINLKTLKI